MSSSSFASTVDLVLKPSARAHAFVFAAHALPLGILPLAMPSGLPLLATGLAFCASWLWLRRHPAFGYGRKAIVRVVWHAEGHWTLARADGATAQARLEGTSSILGRALVLNFALQPQGRATRVLVGDECPPEALRRLRARLAASKDPSGS